MLYPYPHSCHFFTPLYRLASPSVLIFLLPFGPPLTPLPGDLAGDESFSSCVSKNSYPAFISFPGFIVVKYTQHKIYSLNHF